jgi:hypothetical protein
MTVHFLLRLSLAFFFGAGSGDSTTVFRARPLLDLALGGWGSSSSSTSSGSLRSLSSAVADGSLTDTNGNDARGLGAKLGGGISGGRWGMEVSVLDLNSSEVVRGAGLFGGVGRSSLGPQSAGVEETIRAAGSSASLCLYCFRIRAKSLSLSSIVLVVFAEDETQRPSLFLNNLL